MAADRVWGVGARHLTARYSRLVPRTVCVFGTACCKEQKFRLVNALEYSLGPSMGGRYKTAIVKTAVQASMPSTLQRHVVARLFVEEADGALVRRRDVLPPPTGRCLPGHTHGRTHKEWQQLQAVQGRAMLRTCGGASRSAERVSHDRQHGGGVQMAAASQEHGLDHSATVLGHGPSSHQTYP